MLGDAHPFAFLRFLLHLFPVEQFFFGYRAPDGGWPIRALPLKRVPHPFAFALCERMGGSQREATQNPRSVRFNPTPQSMLCGENRRPWPHRCPRWPQKAALGWGTLGRDDARIWRHPLFHTYVVTSDLAVTPETRDHRRGRDGQQGSDSSRFETRDPDLEL